MSLYLLHLFLVFLFAILFLMGGSRLFPVVLLGDLSWPSQTKSLHSKLCILNFHVAVSHSVYVYSSVDQFIGRNVHIWIRRVHPSLFLNVCFLFPYPSVSFVYTGKTYTYVLSPSIYVWNHQFNSFICICSIFIHSFFHPPIHPSICSYAHLPVYWSTCLYNLLHFRYIPFFQTQLSVTKSKVFTCFHSVCSGVCTTQYLIGSDHITPYNEFMAYSCYRTTLHYSVYIYI